MYNSAFLIDGDGRVFGRYHTQVLIPFGEYIPGGSLYPRVYNLSPQTSHFTPGAEITQLQVPGRLRIVSLICDEDVPAGIARAMTAAGAETLLTIFNDAWSGRSMAPYQDEAIALWRAIENRRYFVRVGNTGVTGVVDPFGRVLDRLGLFTAETLRADIHPLRVANRVHAHRRRLCLGHRGGRRRQPGADPLAAAMTAAHRCPSMRARRRLTRRRRPPCRSGVGITLLDVTVVNPADRRRAMTVECIVDSGAIFSIVPAAALRRIGVRPDRSEELTLADGGHVRRRMGDPQFGVAGQRGASPVIFGEPGDAAVIGFVTLGRLGLMLDPLRRELRPLPVLPV